MDLRIFSQLDFLSAIKALFNDLKVPMNYVADEPTSAREILKDTYKDNETFQLMDDVFFVGMVDDAAFDGNKSLDSEKIKSDYDGILIFGVTLKSRPNGLLPTRSQLAEISRAFNREFYYTPVVVVFKYVNYLAFANTERLKYKQEWREGEKAGKVSLLRDVDIQIDKLHSGHERILQELQITTTGNKKVDSFAKLYAHWQDVFSVSLLNKKFYQELSNWYFWARGEVVFPSPPLRIDYDSDGEFDESLDEHNGKNLIRLLTRILFVWFVKEKGLIPHQIFDETFISEELLSEFEPQKPNGFFAQGKHTSRYYRAILQNLFFATLNCEKDKREFRKDGQHQNTTHLMRYKGYFKNPDFFLELMEKHVPFMNGGLFDCLDKPHKEKKGKQGGDIIIYHDGFSDREDNPLSVPDYLFFDKDEQVDLSKEYGQVKYKNVKTKGLLKILESYKFTITENTPIEEDVALDPELLGRVFENLLASYNPETKTTARKQTGSFYTPREIVNYMVDESLIAYLKNSIERELWSCSDEDLDRRLHDLVAFDNQAEFEANDELKGALIGAIDNCKILDPACGSGAFPMGVLQKMVHILSKVDPKNSEWEQRQLKKIDEAISRLDEIDDSEIRDKSIKELNEQKKDIEQAFEKNDLDYGRKLYLIENCIYGIDIQSIAVQISKLRFFISLIVDQYDDRKKDNFGIRPLPNLETKFVAANTLIGVKKGQSLFDNQEVKELEKQIKLLNKKLFSIKTPSRKRELREEIKAVRIKMADILEDKCLDNQSARQLAEWDPFDQNSSSPFFDPEWMFDIQDGFDVVIGNPPYVQLQKDGGNLALLYQKCKYDTFERTGDIYSLFYERGVQLLNDKGILCYITSNKWMRANYGASTRQFFAEKTHPLLLIDFGNIQVFETATVDTNILMLQNKLKTKRHENKGAFAVRIKNDFNIQDQSLRDYVLNNGYYLTSLSQNAWVVGERDIYDIKEFIEQQGVPIGKWTTINYGVKTGLNDAFIIDNEIKENLIKEDPNSIDIIRPILRGRDFAAWHPNFENLWLINSHNGVKSLNIDRINVGKNYPALFKWLTNFKEQLVKRQDSGDDWTNLRNCAYIMDFEKPKIMYPNMTKYLPFIYDETNNFYSNDKSYILTGKNLKYLTCLLNSKLFKYCFSDNFPELQGGTRELRKVFFEKIPVKQITDEQEIPFAKMVDYLVALKKEKSTEISDQLMLVYFEQIANALIYELYFKDEFEKAILTVANPIAQLPNLTNDERIIVQLRKIYVTLNKEESPIKQAVTSMVSIPQVNLINNSISW